MPKLSWWKIAELTPGPHTTITHRRKHTRESSLRIVNHEEQNKTCNTCSDQICHMFLTAYYICILSSLWHIEGLPKYISFSPPLKNKRKQDSLSADVTFDMKQYSRKFSFWFVINPVSVFLNETYKYINFFLRIKSNNIALVYHLSRCLDSHLANWQSSSWRSPVLIIDLFFSVPGKPIKACGAHPPLWGFDTCRCMPFLSNLALTSVYQEDVLMTRFLIGDTINWCYELSAPVRILCEANVCSDCLCQSLIRDCF